MPGPRVRLVTDTAEQRKFTTQRRRKWQHSQPLAACVTLLTRCLQQDTAASVHATSVASRF